MPGPADRLRIDSGSVWEPICGYSRAVRVGDRILVSGTTATHGAGEVVCPGDPAGQAVYILDKIAASLAALGGSARGRGAHPHLSARRRRSGRPVSRVHGRYFGDVRPANTLVEVAGLVGDYEVEIEAEAVVNPSREIPNRTRCEAATGKAAIKEIRTRNAALSRERKLGSEVRRSRQKYLHRLLSYQRRRPVRW